MSQWTRLFLNNLLVIIPGAVAGILQIEGVFDLLQRRWPSICDLALDSSTCKPSIQLELLGIGLVANLIYQVTEVQLPTLNITKAREAILGFQMDPIYETFKAAYATQATATPVARNFARVTVMVPRRSIRGLWLWKDFQFVYQAGFEEDQQDVDMTLYSGQGVAGEAMRFRKPVAQGLSQSTVQLRGWWRLKFPWGMFKSQRERTAHVHWILSVPMIQKGAGPGKRNRVVGVINIDVVDKELAKILGGAQIDNDPVLRSLVANLLLAGYISATLW